VDRVPAALFFDGGGSLGVVPSAVSGDAGRGEIKTHRRAQSAGAQSALAMKPAEERVFRPTLRHLADRVGTRLRAKSRPGPTVTVRVRFADLHSVTRSVTLDAPILATAILAEIAEELVRVVLADHPSETTISLLAISVSHLEKDWHLQLELPLGLEEEERRPGTKRGAARWMADRAIDMIRNRFGWEAVGYGSVASARSWKTTLRRSACTSLTTTCAAFMRALLTVTIRAPLALHVLP
jgi:DNA polymerase-4